MERIALVFTGGGLGAVARYGVTTLMTRWEHSDFPFATLLVNLSGTFLIGLLFSLGLSEAIRPNWRLFLATGFLGGYTTFSSWQLESLVLIRDGHPWMAAANLAGSLVLGLVALLAGVGIGLRLEV